MKVFVSYSSRDRELAESIITLLQEQGHSVSDPIRIHTLGNLLSEISAAIRSADVLVAVAAAGNPNIFYEIGLAAGANVPILIAAFDTEHLPADVSSVPYVQLTGDTVRDTQAIARRMSGLNNRAMAKPTKFESAETVLQEAVNNSAVLEAISPSEYTRLLMDLFKERGYKVESTSPHRGEGIDFVIQSPVTGKCALVEAKKLSRQSLISVEWVRSLVEATSALWDDTAPIIMLIVTSGFTTAAQSLAAQQSVLLLTLEDVLAKKDILATNNSHP